MGREKIDFEGQWKNWLTWPDGVSYGDEHVNTFKPFYSMSDHERSDAHIISSYLLAIF